MSDTKVPIRSTDPEDVIEQGILDSRENNEYERTLVVEAPEGPPPIRATEVPRDDEHRERDTTPVGYMHPEDRAEAERETLLGPYVGPIDGEGTSLTEQEDAMLESATGGKQDKDGNLLHDPGILPGHVDQLPGWRDADGNLIADHLGNGKPAADQGPIRDAIGAGVGPDASEEEQHGSRAEHDADRDLDDPEEAPLAPEHDPDASEEEQKGGRGIEEDRDLGENEDAGKLPEHSEFLDDAEVSDEAEAYNPLSESTPADLAPVNPLQPGGETATEASPGPGDQSLPREDATAEEWRQYARSRGVTVDNTFSKVRTKAALREAGLLK